MSPLRKRQIVSLMIGCAVIGLSLPLSFAFHAPMKAVPARDSSIEAAYAPFDSIRTNFADYIWPTSARPRITSSFAEFRSSHFHAGLDIGTNDTIGAEVYAARDGYVARIDLSPYGYGRHLVLQHVDGFYTAYAHLSAFMEKLERAVRAEQLKQGKFSIEMKFQPNDFPVRKGDVVAYSGESGTGDAHLHFEIRDENFNPVNPLLFPNIRQYTDKEPPVFRRLAVTPMDENSFVDYEFAPKIYLARAGRRSSYSISELIRATGSIGFSIDAVNRVNATRYHSSVYSFEFRVDGATVFTCRRDRFPKEETRQVGLDFDWALWKGRKGEFQKLYLDEENSLPFYNRRSEHDGVIAPRIYAEGRHKFRIIASDYSGNSSELRGAFVLNHPPKVEIVKRPDQSLTAYLPNGNNVASIEISTKSFTSETWRVHEYNARALTFSEDSLSLPVDLNGTDVVRVTAKNIWGTHSFPVYYFFKQPSTAGEATVSREEDGSFLRLLVQSRAPFTAAPSLQVQQGAAVTLVPLRAINLNDYEGIYRLSDTFGGTSYLRAFCEIAGKRGEVSDSFAMNTVSPSKGGKVQSDDGNFTLTFAPHSVFSPLHPMIEQLGPMKYDVYPRDVLLRGAIGVTIGYPPEKESYDKLALYVNSGGGWRFLGTKRDRQTHTLVLRDGLVLGTFAILDDQQRPTISRWCASSRNAKGRPLFSFAVRDNLSGVDSDQINVFLSGERIIPEYDPEKKTVFYVPVDPLPRGRYTVQIEVKDRVGNAAHLAKTLTVYQ